MMQNRTIKALLAMAFLLSPAAYAAQPGKTEVCHVPSGNPENTKLIQVGADGDAVNTHLAHGDWLKTAALCQDDIVDNDCDGSPDASADNYDCVVQTGNEDAMCVDRACVEPPPEVSCPCWSAEELDHIMTGAADGLWYCYNPSDSIDPVTGEVDGLVLEDCDGETGCTFHTAAARDQRRSDPNHVNRQQCYYQEPLTGPSGGLEPPRFFSVANGTLVQEQAALCLAEVKARCATIGQ